MGIFTVSETRHPKLQRFRRNTWKAIALCAALRLADTAFGFGLVEPTQTLAAPAKVSQLGRDDTVDHIAAIYLMTAEGAFRGPSTTRNPTRPCSRNASVRPHDNQSTHHKF